jgi:hypothetical protein
VLRRQRQSTVGNADDWIITCASAREARAALADALRILERLGVQLNPQKTRIVHVRRWRCSGWKQLPQTLLYRELKLVSLLQLHLQSRSPGIRAVDSTGATIDFLLSETRDLNSARRFFQKALAAPGHPRPRVINVDGNPSYPNVVEELKRERVLGSLHFSVSTQE